MRYPPDMKKVELPPFRQEVRIVSQRPYPVNARKGGNSAQFRKNGKKSVLDQVVARFFSTKERDMLKVVWFFYATLFAGIACSVAGAQSRSQKPEMIKVTDRVYCATGYALGNSIFILTDKSAVVVDTTESPLSAREILQDFRKICQLPVSYIIYTHNHGDHVRGAKVFKGERTKIIAQKLLVGELDGYNAQRTYYRRVAGIQFGHSLLPEERGVSLSIFREKNPLNPENGYLPPDIQFDGEFQFEEGGVRFELYHTQGETPDHLMVWLPGERVLLTGDLYYGSFPMLASPMKPDRPVLEWVRSLERMRKLKPEFLVPSHWNPVKGREEVDATLANYARAIRFVHDETYKLLNEGLTLEEIRRQVRLPEDLAKLPYLAETYGRVSWAVTGIYRQYTGWYDFNAVHLNPGNSVAFSRALLEAAGGSEAIIKRARQALNEKNHQLALEMASIIVNGEKDTREAHALCAEAFEKMAATAVNEVEINIYRAAAKEHQQKATK
jgi:alkyl sulfatase BDS1-like metallo-beta-lactamase superfamily hydrolase